MAMLGSSCSPCCGCNGIPWDLCSSVEVTLTGTDILQQYQASSTTAFASTKTSISRGLKGAQYNGTFSLTKISATDPNGNGFFRRSLWRYAFTADNCDSFIEATVYNTPQSSNTIVAIRFRGQSVGYYDWTGAQTYRSLSEMACDLPQSVSAGGNFRYQRFRTWEIQGNTLCTQSAKIANVSATEITLNSMALNVCESFPTTANQNAYLVPCAVSPSGRVPVAYAATWPSTEADGWAGAFSVGTNQWSDGFGVFSFTGGPDWLRWRPRGSTLTTDNFKIPQTIQSYVGPTSPEAVDFVSMTIRM